MKKLIKILGRLILLLFLIVAALVIYLNRDLVYKPTPAKFQCLNIEDGYFVPWDSITGIIYGVGLSYAGHINETASDFNPEADPPIFIKSSDSKLENGGTVNIPSSSNIVKAIERIEPGIADKLSGVSPIPAMMDYEAELGFVLLEDVHSSQLINNSYAPHVGYFMANDLSARSIALLGEGQKNRYEYWGISKSFPGFTPVSSQVWIPNNRIPQSIPCILIETRVNGEIRQNQSTRDLIYTPLQMLQAIHRKYPGRQLKGGDLILTGTPGGVIFSSPRWLVRAANLVGIDRFKKLELSTGDEGLTKFLKAGDSVTVSGSGLGAVEIIILE